MELTDPLKFECKGYEDAREIIPIIRKYVLQNLKLNILKSEAWYDKADITRNGKTVYTRGYIRLTLKERGKIFHKELWFQFCDERIYIYTDNDSIYEWVKLPEEQIDEILRCMNAFVQLTSSEKEDLGDINPSRKEEGKN